MLNARIQNGGDLPFEWHSVAQEGVTRLTILIQDRASGLILPVKYRRRNPTAI